MHHYPNRKLKWIHQYSQMELKYKSAKGKEYILLVTFIQYQLLKQLEGKPVRMSQLDASDGHIKPLLQAGIICSEASSGDTLLFLNESFDCGDDMIDLLPRSKEDIGSTMSPNISDVVAPEGFSERDKYILQCLVVKLVKREKGVSHAYLTQLIRQSWSRDVPLTKEHIQNCLEILEDKSYIEYDPSAHLYRYLP